MDNSAKIKQLGAKMLSDADSSDEQDFGSFYLSRFLGFQTTYKDDLCIVSFEAKSPMFNPQGTLHGGVIATALDVSMGHLLHHKMGAGATLEMNIKYLLPINGGQVRCEGSFIKKGKTIVFLQSHLYRISEAEDWMNKAQKIIFIGTSFSVNITSIALRIAISRGIKIDIVDPNPIKINYDKVNYHQMNAEEYSNFRNLN